jgi:hypothetical protein
LQLNSKFEITVEKIKAKTIGTDRKLTEYLYWIISIMKTDTKTAQMSIRIRKRNLVNLFFCSTVLACNKILNNLVEYFDIMCPINDPAPGYFITVANDHFAPACCNLLTTIYEIPI